MGKPLSSSTYATNPAITITITSKAVLLIANAPTTQNSMITGINTLRGTWRILLATLMHKKPSGIMIKLAMMNSK